MFLHTDTDDAPWTVVKSDCKKRARLNAMRYVLHRCRTPTRTVDRIGPLDPLIVGRPADVYEFGEGTTPTTDGSLQVGAVTAAGVAARAAVREVRGREDEQAGRRVGVAVGAHFDGPRVPIDDRGEVRTAAIEPRRVRLGQRTVGEGDSAHPAIVRAVRDPQT